MDSVKAKIIELVPSVQGVCGNHSYHHDDCLSCDMSTRKITFADVLQAIGGKAPYHIGWSDEGIYFFKNGEDKILARWEPKANYDNQTQEVKDFSGLPSKVKLTITKVHFHGKLRCTA